MTGAPEGQSTRLGLRVVAPGATDGEDVVDEESVGAVEVLLV